MWFYVILPFLAESVLDIAQSDLASVIRSTESALVLFHASSCGHSRQFLPDFTYAGDLLEEAGTTRVFRVDVGLNASFAEEFGGRGFPSVKFYHGGDVRRPVDFDGASATPVALKTWTLKQLRQLTELRTRDDALQLLKRAPFAVVSFFAKENDFYFSEFSHVSRTTPDVEFAFTCSREIADLLNVPAAGGLVVYHPHDAGFSVYAGALDAVEAVELFIRRSRLPLVTKLDHSNPELVLNDGRTILLLVRPEMGNLAEEFANFARLHQARRSEILFLTSGRKEPVEARLLEYLGDFTDQPQYWVIENFHSAGDMRKFRCVSLASCLDDFDAGRLVRFIKSETPALAHPEISDLQGSNFQVALEASVDKPLLVFFLAPWCSACFRFNPLFESPDFIAFAKSLNLSLARIDVAANDTPGLTVLSYPALRLFRGPQVNAFDGDFTQLTQLTSWLTSLFAI